MEKTIIAIIGKTCSGKDTVANYIHHTYGIPPVISYTQKPKRDDQINGEHHWFVSQEEFDKIKADEENLLGYVKFPYTRYEYCATTEIFETQDVVTYVIDPVGLEWLKEHHPDINIIPIILSITDKTLKERSIARGDDPKMLEDRIQSEREMFRGVFEKIKDAHILVEKETYEEFFKTVDAVMSWHKFEKII